MAILQEVAELAFRQMYPNPGDETAITLSEVIATTRHLYSQIMWQLARNEKNTEGYYNVPTALLTETEVEVVDNVMDISGLNILRALPSEIFLQNVGGLTCECEYIKSTLNSSQLLCDDEAFDNCRTYYLIGDKIKFPKGVHKSPLTIIYANNGSNVDGLTYIDDVAAGMLRDKLIDTYNLQKIGKEDNTNNGNGEK